MNQEEILNEIKEDMITAWKSYKRIDYSEPKLFKVAATEFANMLKEDAIAKGYTIKIPKLPRKLKKYYKKHGILPFDVAVTQPIEHLDITIEI